MSRGCHVPDLALDQKALLLHLLGDLRLVVVHEARVGHGDQADVEVERIQDAAGACGKGVRIFEEKEKRMQADYID